MSDISCNGIFSAISPQVRETKYKSKWDYIELKSFCKAKETIEMKWKSTEWENTFFDTSEKGLYIKNVLKTCRIQHKNTIQF